MPSRYQIRMYECDGCNMEWPVAGQPELGRWWPNAGASTLCPECGQEGVWQDSMTSAAKRNNERRRVPR